MRHPSTLWYGCAAVAILLLHPSPADSQPVITTVAGNGAMGFSGDGGPATSAALNQPQGVKVDPAGNLYFVDTANCRVRRVSTAGIVSTFAGNGLCGSSGDGGPAVSATVGDITDIAIDSAGTVYIADATSHRIRKVTPDGIVNSFAGTGEPGYAGDGGPAIVALINRPIGLVIDGAGNLYLSDSASQNIRRVNLASGIITTYAGNGTTGFSGDGGMAVSASLQYPLGLAADSAGNLYLADAGNGVIRKVTPGGLITTVAGVGGQAGFSGDGGAATSALLNIPSGVGVDTSGNLYIGDSGNNRVRRVDAATGAISTLAGGFTNGFSGDGGPAANALLNFPWGIATDASNAIFVADRNNQRIRRIAASTPPASVNLALGRPAFQSTTYPGSSGAAAAVDGITNGNYFNQSVTATISDSDANPWWQVDLGTSATVQSVVIWNRTDCCAERLSNYWVFVSDTPFDANDTPASLQNRPGTFAGFQAAPPQPSTTINVGHAGRYVRVQLSNPGYLSLAEVQVLGSGPPPPPSTDLALGKPATESSTYFGSPAAAAAADGLTDGNFYDGSVTATNYETSPWWQVDLGSSAAIDSIVISNRTDCCITRLSNLWVFVSDTPFLPTDTPAALETRSGTFAAYQAAAPSPTVSIPVGFHGRYVRIQLAGSDYLSLAEVRVLGH